MKQPLTEEQIDKWGKYFRYFYFNEDMTFEEFLKRVERGWTPRKHLVDWSKVQGVYEQ